MKVLNIKRYAGFASIITSGVLAFSGCSTVRTAESIPMNCAGSCDDSIEYSMDTTEPIDEKNYNAVCGRHYMDSIKTNDDNFLVEYQIEDSPLATVCSDEYEIEDSSLATAGSHEYMDHENEDSSLATAGSHEYMNHEDEKPFAYAGQYEYMNDDNNDIPFGYAGQYEYMNNVDIDSFDEIVPGKRVYASGFSGASNNFLVLDDSNYGVGYNVVIYYRGDGNGNVVPNLLCICAKDIDVINGIPVIYFRNDQDVADIISSNGLSTDLGLYSNNVCDYPVNVDENGNQFITFDGIKLNNEYMKVK